MKKSVALSVLILCCVSQANLAGEQETPRVAPTPAPVASSVCPDAITSATYGASPDFQKLERKELEARLQEIAKRASADRRVLEQLQCLMKR